MEFRQLKTFRAVADNQSFTRAAQKLFMAQSSVSAQIKALEQELDVRLFDRIGRRVLITDTGSTLYEYARRMEEMTKEIRSEVSGSSQTRGSLTIRIPETLAAIYMPQIMEDFHGHHPEVKLIFINYSDQKLREESNSDRIDLAFLMTDAVYFKEVNVRLLKTEKLIIVSGLSHPFVGRKRVTYQDLSDQTLLLPKTD